MKKIASALFLFIGMAVALPASATPLVPGYSISFTGTGGASSNGENIFPYLFDITNNSTNATQTNVQMMCIDFNRTISIPETWQASLVQVSNALPTTLFEQQIRALAIIDNAIVNGPASGNLSDEQYAAWSILATSQNGNAGFNAAALAIANDAMTAALGLDGGFNFSNFSYFDPVDGSQSANGDPQRFMLYTPNIGHNVIPSVPEPSSLMLLGTGVLGLASVARRRFKA